jgi:hypothetical protein
VVLSAGSNAGFKDVFFECCLASLYVCPYLPGLPNHQSGVHDIKKLIIYNNNLLPKSVFAKHGRSYFFSEWIQTQTKHKKSLVN